MRIVLVQDYLRSGGTERQTLFFLRAFAERGHEVRLLCFRPGGRLAPDAASFAPTVTQPFDTGLPLLALGATRALQGLQPDVVLCLGRTANCYAARFQRRLPEVPIIGSIRTGKPLFPLHRRALPHLAGVLVNARWWRDRLLAMGLPAERVGVVHNPRHFDLPAPAPERRARVRREFGLGSDTVLFLNVAHFRRGKHHDELIAACARLPREPRWALWLAGDGWLRRRAERQARRLGLADRVRFLGHVNDPVPLYAAADVAVSASREDSLPNFLIEAQTAGLPVVATAWRGVGETFADGETGVLVPARDPNALTAALLPFLHDGERRRAWGQAARPRALRTFDPDRQADAALAFLTARYAAHRRESA